jgi:CBS domain-containing protein
MNMKKIKEMMTASPKTVGKNESLKTVATQMSKSNIGSLPVVDENKKVVGIVTDRDISLAISKSDKSINDIRVMDVMTPDVHTCKEEDDPQTALGIMRSKKVGRLPVVNTENKLTGIITLDGILRKAQNTPLKDELIHTGKENVINTLNAIAERNELVHA